MREGGDVGDGFPAMDSAIVASIRAASGGAMDGGLCAARAARVRQPIVAELYPAPGRAGLLQATFGPSAVMRTIDMQFDDGGRSTAFETFDADACVRLPVAPMAERQWTCPTTGHGEWYSGNFCSRWLGNFRPGGTRCAQHFNRREATMEIDRNGRGVPEQEQDDLQPYRELAAKAGGDAGVQALVALPTLIERVAYAERVANLAEKDVDRSLQTQARLHKRTQAAEAGATRAGRRVRALEHRLTQLGLFAEVLVREADDRARNPSIALAVSYALTEKLRAFAHDQKLEPPALDPLEVAADAVAIEIGKARGALQGRGEGLAGQVQRHMEEMVDIGQAAAETARTNLAAEVLRLQQALSAALGRERHLQDELTTCDADRAMWQADAGSLRQKLELADRFDAAKSDGRQVAVDAAAAAEIAQLQSALRSCEASRAVAFAELSRRTPLSPEQATDGVDGLRRSLGSAQERERDLAASLQARTDEVDTLRRRLRDLDDQRADGGGYDAELIGNLRRKNSDYRQEIRDLKVRLGDETQAAGQIALALRERDAARQALASCERSRDGLRYGSVTNLARADQAELLAHEAQEKRFAAERESNERTIEADRLMARVLDLEAQLKTALAGQSFQAATAGVRDEAAGIMAQAIALLGGQPHEGLLDLAGKMGALRAAVQKYIDVLDRCGHSPSSELRDTLARLKGG